MLIKGEYARNTYRKINNKTYVAVTTKEGFTRFVPYVQDFNEISVKFENQKKKIDYLSKTLEDLQEFISEYFEQQDLKSD
jgi:hypothetical protein